MKLSIVATLYRSAPHIEEFWRRTGAVARHLVDEDYEIVLVNDGSPDESLTIAIGLTKEDPHLTVIDLSRNFGHHKAMMTGLAQARGDRVFLIDSDLEEEPEWLIGFSEQLERDNCDVVYGVQGQRRGGWFDRWSGKVYYRLLRAMTGLAMPDDYVTARLMSRRYVNALLLHDEREIDIGGLWLVTGFEQREQTVRKRVTSQTTYTLRRKVSLFLNSITSFSNAPLIGIFYIGVAILLIAGAYSVYVFIQWLLSSDPVSGWTSLIISVWLLGGLIISFIGVIGIYLAKIFSETKRRPYTIIREIYGKHAQ